jgi:hypothetical protein
MYVYTLVMMKRVSTIHTSGKLTSKIKVTKAPFMQLFTINCFISSGAATKQVPLLYVIMSRRRKKDYLAVFRSLLHLLPRTSVQKFVADFEKGLWNALWYPSTSLFVRMA